MPNGPPESPLQLRLIDVHAGAPYHLANGNFDHSA
ncbi:hypothetical protein ACVIM8_001851 [Bradyrhizobium sp. USDA 4529]